jgi:hypothetical protein
MILEMDLDSLGVTKDDVANFMQAEFERADIDDSGTITFEEFVQYYNGLQDYLRDKLTVETKNHHVITKYREEYIEAKSLQVPVRDRAILSQAFNKAPIRDGQMCSTQVELKNLFTTYNGKLLLDAHAHQYNVEVTFPDPGIVTSKNGNSWVSFMGGGSSTLP